eukprot:TRINITY_DN57972_c0_g1_i1.p1 TRINITY_DN57972_c0_g1~~TRINITY_DN57972_c0_g1_i1.p1  ORF type:complete len:340 (+),score=41.56 TRINITY_DN57972_c0_g1_i1:74-1021(+)
MLSRLRMIVNSVALSLALFLACFVVTLIFAGIGAAMLSPNGVEGCGADAPTSALCRGRSSYGDFGTMLVFMLSSFSGVTYVDFAEISKAAGDGSNENHGFSIIAILVALLGKVYLAAWAILTMRTIAPPVKRWAATKSSILLVCLFFVCLLPLLVFSGIAAALLSPSGVEGGCGSNPQNHPSMLCHQRAHYGDGGAMFILMLSSFAGVTFMSAEQLSIAAGEGTRANHGLSILVIMAGLVGRGMIMSWAAVTFHWFLKSAAEGSSLQEWERQVAFVEGMAATQVGAPQENDADLHKAIEESMQNQESQPSPLVGV